MILAADLRFPGGTSQAVADEIRALHDAGLRVGVAALRFRDLDNSLAVHPRIREVLERRWAVRIERGRASAPLAVVHNPTLLDRLDHDGDLDLAAEVCVVVAHHLPVDPAGRPCYDVARIERNARRIFGRSLVWAPNSPVCRRAFVEHGLHVTLLRDDWRNVVFPDDWGTARDRPRFDVLTIGRHSRSEPEKWPDSIDDLLAAYPDDPDVRVRLLGVDDSLLRRLPAVPSSWTTLPFGSMPVAEFLETIDFLVYFHHHLLRESFGRCVAEAVSAGVVCIVPEYLRETFGPAALYSTPQESTALARRLFEHPAEYGAQSRSAREHLEATYGPARHVKLVTDTIEAARHGSLRDDRVEEIGLSGAAAVARAKLRARGIMVAGIVKPARRAARAAGRLFGRG